MLQRERALYHVVVSQWTLKWSKLVKYGQMFKSSQRSVKLKGFKSKYRYIWIFQQIWSTRLQSVDLKN